MLGGIAPIIIFTFYKSIPTPSFLSSFISTPQIPLLPIPIYLDEKLTGIILDDYNRNITVENTQESGATFEKVLGDVVVLKFGAKKNNIVLTAITALLGQVLNYVNKKEYKITLFYDNIFILDASLESFQTNLRDGTDFREITITIATRPPKTITTSQAIPGEVGNGGGL